MELTKLHEELREKLVGKYLPSDFHYEYGETNDKFEFEEIELSNGVTAVYNCTAKGKVTENKGDWYTPSTFSYEVELKVTHVHYYDYNGESIGSADNPICLTLNQ